MPMSRHQRFLKSILFLGDLVILYLAIFLSLWARRGVFPFFEDFADHSVQLSIVFIFWLMIFAVFGLYDVYRSVFVERLVRLVVQAQIINALIAVLILYTLPIFTVAPKVTLLIYVAVSAVLIVLWRLVIVRVFSLGKLTMRVSETSSSVDELIQTVNSQARYPIKIEKAPLVSSAVGNASFWALSPREIEDLARQTSGGSRNRAIENIFLGQQPYVDLVDVYGEVYGCLPLDIVDGRWIVDHISHVPRVVYTVIKRLSDIVASVILLVFSSPFWLFTAIAIKIEDGGPVFFVQKRIGQYGSIIKIIKFRSMSVHAERDGIAKTPTVTRIGSYIRKLRIDELPQLINVLRGDVSLIGPRPEIPALVDKYIEAIPFYHVRHSVKPGLSGWAQLYQKQPPKFSTPDQTAETRTKLSYDLFYIKNRSLVLDALIALRTAWELALRRGV